MAVITAAQAREAIPQLTGTGKDSDLDLFIARLEDAAARYCGWTVPDGSRDRTFVSASYVELVDVMATKPTELHCGAMPITAITSIYDDEDWTYDQATDLVDSGDYVYGSYQDGDGHVIYLKRTSAHGAFSTGKRNVQVTYTAGFTSGDVPPELEQAMIDLTAWAWQKRGMAGKTSVSRQGKSATRVPKPDEWPAAVKMALGCVMLPSAIL